MSKSLLAKYWPIPILFLTVVGLVLFNSWYFVLLPFLTGCVLLSIHNFKAVFFLLYLAVPLSFDYDLPNGSSVDMFSEPLMIIFSGVFFILIIPNKFARFNQLKDLPYYLVALHLIYLAFSIGFSADSWVSFKYLLAKSWFLISLFFLPSILNLTFSDIKKIILLLVVGLLITILYTSINHAKSGFTFERISYCSEPFFINHVNYSTALGVAFPFLLFLYKEAPRESIERIFLWRGTIIIFLVGIALSYTRATWLSIIILPIFIFIFQKKLLKIVFIIAIAAIATVSTYLIQDDNYLKYAPDYETTVFYRDSFGEHMNATFEMKDVSGMERIYRWIASVKMFADNPIMGVGPNTFYPNYYNYTVSSFQTYVSDNPEKSTVHNYFLLLLSEQGIIGFSLFVSFLFLVINRGYKTYFTEISQSKKNLIIACFGSISILLLHLSLNDLVEVDKIAAAFFLSCVILLKIKDIKEG